MCSTLNSEENFIIETERLLLRQMKMQDSNDLFAIWSDPEVARYMNISPLTEVAQAQEMIEKLTSLAKEQKAIRWSIILRENNQLIGTGGFNTWVKEEAYRGEIGYDLRRQYWGRGIMTEALHALLSFGFKSMGLNRIEALVVPDNVASFRLLQKLGFCEEGLLREYQFSKGKFDDLKMLSLLKREYK